MAEKCILCGEKTKETFLGKLGGTRIKVKKGEKNQWYMVCSDCQKKHENTKEEVLKTIA